MALHSYCVCYSSVTGVLSKFVSLSTAAHLGLLVARNLHSKQVLAWSLSPFGRQDAMLLFTSLLSVAALCKKTVCEVQELKSYRLLGGK